MDRGRIRAAAATTAARTTTGLVAAVLSACAPDPIVDGASSGESSTGEGPCVPMAAAAIVDEHRGGDPGVPSLGRRAVVAGDGAGNLVAAMTDEGDGDEDVVVSSFDAAGALRWTVRYAGTAGLADAPLGLAVDDGGDAYVLVREQTAEIATGGGPPRVEYALIVLAIGGDGAQGWRFDRGIPAGSLDNARAGAIAIAPDGRVLVVDADATSEAIAPPSLTELDAAGDVGGRVDLDVALQDVVYLAIDVAGDDVLVAASPYDATWIARVGRDGAIAWQERSEGEARATAIAAGRDDDAWVLLATGDEEAGDAGFALQRYDATGAMTVVLAQEFAGGSGYPAGVVVDCDGTALVITEDTGPSWKTAWLGAVTPDGGLAWSTELASMGTRMPRSAVAIPGGGIAVGGVEVSDPLAPWIARVEAP